MISRIDREKRTITALIQIFCRAQGHPPFESGGLCLSCQGLRDYAYARLDACRYKSAKPTCRNCRIHCYQPQFRERIRAVMKFSGPRMLLSHPVLCFRHAVDEIGEVLRRKWNLFEG